MELLLIAAVLPVVALCFYIYKKDTHKEPMKVLATLFGLGVLSCIPVIIGEIFAGIFFDTDTESLPFILIFINVFFGVAIIEEGFKWLVSYFFGYKNREFDEIYDIIVYTVFASLGFACIENIMYVFENGFGTAVLRALTSIPGHACFGILMGYYLSKAKVNEENNQKGMAAKNIVFSILAPTLFHTMYDALLSTDNDILFLLFFVFDIAMVVYCFIIVHKMSKIQQNFTTNVQQGYITQTQQGYITYSNPTPKAPIHFCPLCGRNVDAYNFCPSCGVKVK